MRVAEETTQMTSHITKIPPRAQRMIIKTLSKNKNWVKIENLKTEENYVGRFSGEFLN